MKDLLEKPIGLSTASKYTALNGVGYKGPLSLEWEDSGMDREWGAPEALAMIRKQDFTASSVAFDAAFASKK